MTTSRWPKLTRAPIVEGLIDIRVERSATIDVATLQAASDELAEQFPSRQERRMWLGEISMSPREPVSIATRFDEPDGVMLRSADDRTVAQFRLDGLTVSRLSPYSSWEELKELTRGLWHRYRAAARPLKVVRVATRFINRVPLASGESFDRTFSTTFAMSPALPQAVAGFLLRVIVPFESDGVMAIVTQALEVNSGDCIFDIDAFAERSEGLSEEHLWEQLEMLRAVKNRIFFGSLTPEAVERFT